MGALHLELETGKLFKKIQGEGHFATRLPRSQVPSTWGMKGGWHLQHGDERGWVPFTWKLKNAYLLLPQNIKLMEFQQGQIYHVFNQGNNRQEIFIEDENYLFFLRKIRKHILPSADIICYCLMPNHFHMLIQPTSLGLILSKSKKPSRTTSSGIYQNNLSQSIGLLLSSYSKAINARYGRSGSLFRAKTKVKDGWIEGFISLEGDNKDWFFRPDNNYAVQCFEYIHQNPVKAKLVKRAIDWRYSSASDYAGLRSGSICNLKLGRELLGI